MAIGGSDGQSTLSSVEEFNYGAGTWRNLAAMSRPRIWLAAATLGDATFAAGGYDGAEYLNLVEVYRPGPEVRGKRGRRGRDGGEGWVGAQLLLVDADSIVDPRVLLLLADKSKKAHLGV